MCPCVLIYSNMHAMLVGGGAEEGFASPGFGDKVGCELPIEVLCKVSAWP